MARLQPGGGVWDVRDGVIALENLPPDAEVFVDGGNVTVKYADYKAR